MLSLLIGGTTYTFSLILAAFLVGLGHRQRGGRGAREERPAAPRLALGWCQALLCVGMAWAAYMLSASLPFWPIDPSLADSPWFNFQIDFVRSLWVDAAGHAALGRELPARAGGAACPRGTTRRGWSAASTPRTPSAPSSDRSAPASSSSRPSAASTRSSC